MAKEDNSLSFLNISPYVRYIHHQSDACNENYYIPWRYIYDYELIFVVDGEMTVLEETDSYTLKANDLHIMEPMIRHRRYIPEGTVCDYYSIHFDVSYVDDNIDFSPTDTYINKLNKRNITAIPIDQQLNKRIIYSIGDITLPKKMHMSHTTELIHLLKSLNDCFQKKEFAYEIDMKCGMLNILKIIITGIRSEIMPVSTDDGDHISAIIQHIYSHYNEDIHFHAIAIIYGYSYSNLRKQFKLRTSKSLNRFLTDVRMEKATELLRSGKYNITEIAGMTGYQDSGYFSRVYKQNTGLLPSEFLKVKHP